MNGYVDTVVGDRFRMFRETGDVTVRNELVEEFEWLTTYCAQRFSHRGEPLADLVQVASIGLVNAVNRFDPSRGVAFPTFALPTIVGELRRYFRDKTWSVHVPRRAKELNQRVGAAADELLGALRRSPTVAEIAEHAGLTIDEVLDGLEVEECARGRSLDGGRQVEADDGAAEAGALGVDEPGFARAEARCVVGPLLRSLPTERDRVVMELRFLECLSQSAIAERVGVSQVQVSRLIRANLARMRQAASRKCRPLAEASS